MCHVPTLHGSQVVHYVGIYFLSFLTMEDGKQIFFFLNLETQLWCLVLAAES